MMIIWEQTSWQPGNRPGDGWRVNWQPRKTGSGARWVSYPNCMLSEEQPENATTYLNASYTRGIPRGWGEIPNRMDLTESNSNAQSNRSRCVCGKTYKKQRGLKIHQSRMKCLEGVTGSNVQVQALVKRRRCRDRSHTTVPSPSKPQFLSFWPRSPERR